MPIEYCPNCNLRISQPLGTRFYKCTNDFCIKSEIGSGFNYLIENNKIIYLYYPIIKKNKRYSFLFQNNLLKFRLGHTYNNFINLYQVEILAEDIILFIKNNLDKLIKLSLFL